MRRLVRLPVLVLVLTLAAIAGVALLENHADTNRKAELQVSSLRFSLLDLAGAPFIANPPAGSPSAVIALSKIRADEAVLSRGLATNSGVRASAGSLVAANSNLASIKSSVASVYAITVQSVSASAVKQIRSLQASLALHTGRLLSVLDRIGRSDGKRARAARVQAEVGTALAMLMLVGVFMIFYVRSVRTRRENERLLGASRIEASTDALTGIGNRRALVEHLTHAISSPEREPELLLAIFDLNGFKQYNDTFGHGAGDALLARLGGRLAAATDRAGTAYRMGGDEFCLLARCTPHVAKGLLAAAISALAEQGDGWHIDCAYGAAWVPSEASTASAALMVADERMYADKATRPSASRQPTENMLAFRDDHLDGPVSDHAERAGQVCGPLDRAQTEARARLPAAPR